jgi:hypothetical protein
MITVAAVGIIAGFVVPFIKYQTEKSKTCYDLRGQITIILDYTCSSATNTSIEIQRNKKADIKIEKLIFTLRNNEGDSRRYEVSDGAQTSGVRMRNNNLQLEIPEDGFKTYVFDFPNAEYMTVTPSSKGFQCDAVEEKVYPC